MIPKKKRVSRSIFPEVIQKGKIRSTPAFSLRFLTNKGQSKGSVVVSKAVLKSAVARNTLKRRWYKALLPFLPETGVYVLFLKKEAIKLSLKEAGELLGRVF
jgi:ribonuclease P protein component